MRNRFSIYILSVLMCVFFACKKDKRVIVIKSTVPVSLLYTDSVFYINAANKNLIEPKSTETGTFTSTPDGLQIDANTGEIDINKSETGLKYIVSFTSSGTGETHSSPLIISGINYLDKIFNLSAGDSVANAIYNANSRLPIPGQNGIFDQGGGCGKAGIVVNSQTATINLAESVRNQGIDTGATQEVKLAYRINDNSNQALNCLDVKIYFYRTAAEIPQYLLDLLNERKGTILTSNSVRAPLALNSAYSLSSQAAKPVRTRPPCIIVVSR